MPDETNPPAPAGGTTPQQPPAGGAPAPDGGAPPPAVAIQMTSEQLKQRLEEERGKGDRNARTAVLKELGFDKLDDAKAVIAAAKKLEQESLSEKEKLSRERDELKPRAQRAAVLEPLLASMVEEQFKALPEAVQTAIDEVAKGDVERRLELMAVMRKAGLGSAPAGGQPPPAGPPPPATRGGSPPPPPAGGAKTKYQEWSDLTKAGNTTMADLFYQFNKLEIERTRPADQ